MSNLGKLASGFFGENDPRGMPRHFFWGSKELNYDSAIRADVSKQNFSICPRYWYVDARFQCARCRNEFIFTAVEQKAWYEDYGFYVDSCAKHCLTCRNARRHLKELRQEYDRDISAALQTADRRIKHRLTDVIDALCEGTRNLPEKMRENRRLLAQQIADIPGGTTEPSEIAES